MENITLESLIKEQQSRIIKLHECDFYPYYDYDEDEKTKYQRWLVNSIRLINIMYPNDKFVQEFEILSNFDISPKQQTRLLVILESLISLPTIIPMKKSNDNTEKDAIKIETTINNANSQSQNQEQSFSYNLFLEAIKDDLTGRQIKELKQVIVDNNNDLERAKPGIVEKLKSFGSDVAVNIVANLITNPSIWNLI